MRGKALSATFMAPGHDQDGAHDENGTGPVAVAQTRSFALADHRVAVTSAALLFRLCPELRDHVRRVNGVETMAYSLLAQLAMGLLVCSRNFSEESVGASPVWAALIDPAALAAAINAVSESGFLRGPYTVSALAMALVASRDRMGSAECDGAFILRASSLVATGRVRKDEALGDAIARLEARRVERLRLPHRARACRRRGASRSRRHEIATTTCR